MKKTQTTKLKLSKETLHHLGEQDLQNAAGGVTEGCGHVLTVISAVFSCWGGQCGA